jgi:hypothetical protein
LIKIIIDNFKRDRIKEFFPNLIFFKYETGFAFNLTDLKWTTNHSSKNVNILLAKIRGKRGMRVIYR